MAIYQPVDQRNTGVYQRQPDMLHYSPLHEPDGAAQHGGQVVNQLHNGANEPNSYVNRQTADENEGCFRIVRSSKHVKIPCTRNVTKRYKVSVPKTVNEKVPRRVEYTDYESRQREEPYTVKRSETAYRDEDQAYTVQVPKKVTRMVKVTKKVPKTIYVDVVTTEPQEFTIYESETRNRRVKVPYQKEVEHQEYRKITEKVPVTKYRTEYDTVTKTVYEDQWGTKLVPVTKIIHKEIPVWQVVPTGDCGNCDQVDYNAARKESAQNTANVHQEATDRDTNAEMQIPQPTATQYQNTNVNVQQTLLPVKQRVPPVGQYDQKTIETGTELTLGMHPGQVMKDSDPRQVVHQSGNAQRMAPVQNMNYRDGAQWTNQQGASMPNDRQQRNAPNAVAPQYP